MEFVRLKCTTPQVWNMNKETTALLSQHWHYKYVNGDSDILCVLVLVNVHTGIHALVQQSGQNSFYKYPTTIH